MTKATTCWLSSQSPRLDFIRASHWLREQHLLPEVKCGQIHADALIHPTAVVEAGAALRPGCIIGPHVHMHACVIIGRNGPVRASTVIGHDGFGYERDGSGRPLHFAHLGRVVIEEDVDIGNLCSIGHGALQATHIGNSVKIDDQAYMAHNVIVQANTLVMSGVRLNGRIRVGVGCWIGTGALVRECCCIGDGAPVGMGSVVVRDIPVGKTVAGNPARMTE